MKVKSTIHTKLGTQMKKESELISDKVFKGQAGIKS